MASECIVNEDCGPNEYCFSKTEWYEEQLPWPNNTGFLPGCACNTYYGWTGNECDEFTSDTFILVGFSVILLLVNIISVVLLCITAKKHVSRQGNYKLSTGLCTTLLTIPGAIGGAFWVFADVGRLVLYSLVLVWRRC